METSLLVVVSLLWLILSTLVNSCEEIKDLCRCHLDDANCFFINDGKSACESVSNVCSSPKFMFAPEECVRSKSFYAFSGTICRFDKASSASKNCAIEQVILAVNFHGQAHKDVDGIAYKADVEQPYQDQKNGMKWPANASSVIGAPAEDSEQLYRSTVFGAGVDSSGSGEYRCIKYLVPLKEVGYYQLRIKTLEVANTHRQFTVMMDQMKVLNEFEILDHSKSVFQVLDILINFKILPAGDGKGISMKLKGWDPSPIHKGEVVLSFCNSICAQVKDKNFQLSAFAVIKFSTQLPLPTTTTMRPISSNFGPPPPPPTSTTPPKTSSSTMLPKTNLTTTGKTKKPLKPSPNSAWSTAPPLKRKK